MRLLLKIAMAWLSFVALAHGAFPEKPIRIIVPYAAGGGADSAARLIATKMTEQLGQPVIVDNRPGGNAVIGTTAIAKAEPDGYTIGMVISAHAITPFVGKALSYDPQKDFEPLAYVARMPGIVLVSPSLPVSSVGELVALARRQPGKLFYAVPGGLTNGHVSMELLKLATSIDVTPVAFKGGAPAVLEVSSGRVEMLIVAPPAAMPFIQAGKLKPIVVTGATRLRQLNEIPTLMESGYPDFETYEWFAMLAPAKTPAAIVDRISGSVSNALKDPAVIDRLSNLGLEVVNHGPEGLKKMLDAEFKKMKALTRVVKFEIE